MKNFPKHLNSKADYEYIREHFPRAEWLPCWKALLTNRKNWFATGMLDSKEAGIEDATHRIRADTANAKNEGAEDTYTYYQEELKDDASSDFFRMRFTEEEVKAAISGKYRRHHERNA